MKKGIFIFILLILALFSVSCVCAADVDDAIAISEDAVAIETSQSDEMTASDDSNVLELIDDEELILEDNDVDKPMLGEGASTGSFTDLDDLINNQYDSNDTITLSCNYTFNGTDDDDSGFIHGIGINRRVTIDGKGCTIDGSQKARIFNISADNVIIKNITFTNGNANGDNFEDFRGGAIYWIGSNAEVLDCTFTHNNGVNGEGGAIFCDGGRINFFNCTFTDNSALQGGAIKNRGDDYHITNCIFTNNHANDGGAIFQRGYNTTISNSTFTNNNARSGGAIYQNSDNVTISNSIFADNSASRYGGAIIWAYGDYGDVLNCIFTNNSSPLGCAIHLFQYRQNEFNVSKCSFVRNTGNYTIWLMSYISFIYSKINNNIFLDNIVDSNILFDTQTSDYTNVEINADNNWFGNTASNYAQRPIDNDNIICDSWLFLNGTANPDNISVFDSSSIAFKLFKYNSSSEDITEYDNTLLLPINLTITSTNGDVIHTANLGDSIRYTATSMGTGRITASIENVKCTIETTNLGLNPDLSVDSQEADYSNRTIIAINYNSSATGTVNITLKGKNGNNYTFTNLALNATILLPEAINADEYVVNVAYSGDNAFLNATATGTLTVNKANSTLTINDNVTFDYNTNGSTTVSYTNASGVNASVMGQPNAIVVVNDTTITVSGLDAGNYTLTVTTITDANHNNITKNATITVNKLKTQLTANEITTTYNIDKDLVITLKDSTGKALSGVSVTVDLNGAKTYTTDSNGQVRVSTKGLAPKAYTAKVTFNGNTNYDESSKDVKVTVKKATPKLTAKKKTFKTSVKTKKYTIVLKDNTGKAIKKAKVILKVKGKTYQATTNSKGKATFKITKLTKKGTYKATITFKGDKFYKKVSKKTKIKVIVTFKTVSKGSKDKATVKKIQQALKNNGYYLTYQGHYLMVDGKFNSCTERSVREFQHDNGLKVTGNVYEKTAQKLKII